MVGQNSNHIQVSTKTLVIIVTDKIRPYVLSACFYDSSFSKVNFTMSKVSVLFCKINAQNGMKHFFFVSQWMNYILNYTHSIISDVSVF